MIEIGGKQFKTLADPIYVDGRKVMEVYANGQKVYPDKDPNKLDTLIKIIGRAYHRVITPTGLHTADSILKDNGSSRQFRALSTFGGEIYTVSASFVLVLEIAGDYGLAIDMTKYQPKSFALRTPEDIMDYYKPSRYSANIYALFSDTVNRPILYSVYKDHPFAPPTTSRHKNLLFPTRIEKIAFRFSASPIPIRFHYADELKSPSPMYIHPYAYQYQNITSEFTDHQYFNNTVFANVNSIGTGIGYLNTFDGAPIAWTMYGEGDDLGRQVLGLSGISICYTSSSGNAVEPILYNRKEINMLTNEVLANDTLSIDDPFISIVNIPITKCLYLGPGGDSAPEWAKNIYQSDLDLY